jgi:two-component system nitrogen regulation response regulator GlnG
MPAGNILVADDDAAIRTVLNQARRGPVTVRPPAAQRPWRWVSQGDGDLVITDGHAGRKCIRSVAAHKENAPELPVIIMSAQNTFITAVRASNGAYEYLPKPFDLRS